MIDKFERHQFIFAHLASTSSNVSELACQGATLSRCYQESLRRRRKLRGEQPRDKTRDSEASLKCSLRANAEVSLIFQRRLDVGRESDRDFVIQFQLPAPPESKSYLKAMSANGASVQCESQRAHAVGQVMRAAGRRRDDQSLSLLRVSLPSALPPEQQAPSFGPEALKPARYMCSDSSKLQWSVSRGEPTPPRPRPQRAHLPRPGTTLEAEVNVSFFLSSKKLTFCQFICQKSTCRSRPHPHLGQI